VWCSGYINNTFVFSPGQYTGNCTISFAISDGPDYANGTIVVNMANNKPVTTQKFFSRHWSVVASGVTLPNIDAGDSDADLDPLSIPAVLTPVPYQANAVKSGTNSMIVTSIPGATVVNSNMTIGYILSDLASNSTGTVILYISNQIPVGVADTFVVNGTLGVSVNLKVLANDLDGDQPTYDNVLTISSFTQPAVGNLSLSPDRTYLIYTAPDNVTRVLNFTYTVTDGISISTDTAVTIRLICTSPNGCVCDVGFIGQRCEFTVCFGKNSSDSSICSGRGSCNTPGKCSCNPGSSATV
jgi:hypothetical protein